MVRVESDYYTGWFIVHEGKVINASSILQDLIIGKTYHEVQNKLVKNGFKISVVRTDI